MALSPRSSNYERLEGGMGPSKLPNKKKFAWKKFAIGAAVIIGLVWLFGPRERREKLSTPWSTWDDSKVEGPPTYNPAVPNNQHMGHDDDTEPLPPSGSTSKPHGHPTSFEEDTDPSKTTYCTSPHSSASRLVQWALMIDAGSTGSRIHIYKFNNCNKNPTFEYEVFKMTRPGLSSYAEEPQKAAASLDELLNEAIRVVPKSLHKCAPVAVKATAGLRLLPGSQSADILKAIEDKLQKDYPFQLPNDAVSIMDGKDEGVFAWITANYLLDTIRGTSGASADTYAVLDLGGASTQIVFEPKFTKPDSSLADGEHKYDLDFLGKKYELYQHSYLGYGLMRARARVHQLVEFMASLKLPDVTTGSSEAIPVIGNPCLAKGTKKDIEVEDERSKTSRNVTMDGELVGSFEACNRVMELVMAKDAICEKKPCSFDGVYQPSLLDTFATGKVLLLSYFFDRLDPLLSTQPKSLDTGIIPPTNPDDNPKLRISSIASLAKVICQGKSAWLEHFKAISPELMGELEDRPEWCLDLTFMHALLRLGYEFDETREVTIGKKIAGTELGWCLGATIAMVGGGEIKCRI
ncbi:nucleoside diphosphatase gda1 [Moniliophthora roreri MCA 2997]|nr:nucleoside diphosphatase gda1 [Moniliophthora roreri MCA 2997]KAI3609471.1 nucleoside diphosphatase gda1 [Moniliophthora roreri]